jgi:RNA polymerase sigma-70 factor, ECF subfamily
MAQAVPERNEALTPPSPPLEGDLSGQSAARGVTIGELVGEHHALVYRYAYRLTGSQADAEDLSQQAFLLAHQRLAQLREPERAAGWLMTIVRNCFLKSRRRQMATCESIEHDAVAEPVEPFPDWVDPEQLHAALARLPAEARTILVLFFFEECSYKEIAEALEVPIGTVMSRLSRAKSRLREELTRVESSASRRPKPEAERLPEKDSPLGARY